MKFNFSLYIIKILESCNQNVYKVHRGISPEILNNLFLLRQADQYNFKNAKNVNHGFESLRYLGPKIWETIPSYLK